MAIATICLSLIIAPNPGKIQATNLPDYFPNLQAHPLPPALAQWQRIENAGDYFNKIDTTPLGYLVWSEFPLKIYLEQPNTIEEDNASDIRFQGWVDAVKQAIEEWKIYLPLIEVKDKQKANIIIERSSPPIKPTTTNPETGLFNLPRASTAQTQYKFYLNKKQQLSHTMTITITPNQSNNATLATARHEIGHALGIWGHSTIETDTLYFSQVANSPPISPRDINTLQKIYQQPTRLGWPLK